MVEVGLMAVILRRSVASAPTFVVCCNIGASTSFDGCERFFFEAVVVVVVVVVVVNDSAAPTDAAARLLFTLPWVRMADTGADTGTRTTVSAVAASARHAVSAHRCARASRNERARARAVGGRRRREVPVVLATALVVLRRAEEEADEDATEAAEAVLDRFRGGASSANEDVSV